MKDTRGGDPGGDDNVWFKCRFCRDVFSKKKLMQKHRKTEHPQSPGQPLGKTGDGGGKDGKMKIFAKQTKMTTIAETTRILIDSRPQIDEFPSPATIIDQIHPPSPRIFPNAAAALNELVGGENLVHQPIKISSQSNVGWKYNKKFRLDIVPSFSLTLNQAKRAYSKVKFLPPPPPPPPPPPLPPPTHPPIKNVFQFENESIRDQKAVQCECIICGETFESIADALVHSRKLHDPLVAKPKFSPQEGNQGDQKFSLINSAPLDSKCDDEKSELKFEIAPATPPQVDQNGGQCLGCPACSDFGQMDSPTKPLWDVEANPNSKNIPPSTIQKKMAPKISNNTNSQNKPKQSPSNKSLKGGTSDVKILRKNFKKQYFAGNFVHVCKICCNLFDSMAMALDHVNVHEKGNTEQIVQNFDQIAKDVLGNSSPHKRKLMMKREIIESQISDHEMAEFSNFLSVNEEDSVDSDAASVTEVYDEEDEKDKIYCECRRTAFGRMVMCDRRKCPIQWFHYECVHLQAKPKGRWYCPQCVVERNENVA